MQLYDGGRAPNPRRVRVFLAEKGITLPLVPVDLGKLEHKRPAFTAINPLQRVPALVLDAGTVIAESVAICRYFEETHPEPPLFGVGAIDRATVEMWNRRMEFELLFPVTQVFRHLHPAMAEMEVPQVPAWGEANKPRVMAFLALLDEALRGRRYVAGEALSIADITGLVAIDFMKPARLAVPEHLTQVRRWHADLSARPSAAA
ncbi:glutathione S-transferase [Chelatococcus sp. SYSU_G07232]|uniref:Glutathione S-transferase n=1 Tax=Chelatococcus albus TaxID=3047466 RepID=A0ABT7AKA2_9HYPH|nr:glutathione S-transferase [Chelatococcus sp. SYSU_G07232]MDJ1159800.1 glutathione S-transferase [Chelatococcus sp. SYSU_G07232]